MKLYDMSKSIFYERYKPQCIDDLILPEVLKTRLQDQAKTQDFPNIGLFSSNPGCILPGTKIEVKANKNILTSNDIRKKYNLSKNEIVKLRNYIGHELDDNLITKKIIEVVKLRGSLAYSCARCFLEDKKYENKHLKFSHWLYASKTIEEALKETKRIRKFIKYFDENTYECNKYNPHSKQETMLKTQFDIIYSKCNKITELYVNFDKIWCVEFWINRGWSLEESKNKISNYQKENIKKLESKYSDEQLNKIRAYGQTTQKFIDNGYTEEDAIQLLKKRQATFSLKTCIQKYGFDKGNEIFNQRQIKWQNTLKSKSQEEIDEINRRKSNGYNNFKYPVGTEGILYYVKYYNDNECFWKIGITKYDANHRLRLDNLKNYNYEIIFEKEYDEICDAFNDEQLILNKFNNNRISIQNEDIKTTEAFNEDVLKEVYENL